MFEWAFLRGCIPTWISVSHHGSSELQRILQLWSIPKFAFPGSHSCQDPVRERLCDADLRVDSDRLCRGARRGCLGYRADPASAPDVPARWVVTGLAAVAACEVAGGLSRELPP